MPDGSTIEFSNMEQLTTFLCHYESSGVTSLFDIKEINDRWILTFNGAF